MNRDQRRQIKVLKRRAKVRAIKDSINQLLGNNPKARGAYAHFVKVLRPHPGYVLVRNAVQPAPWLPASPIIDGVRMRYSKGRLVPRTQTA